MGGIRLARGPARPGRDTTVAAGASRPHVPVVTGCRGMGRHKPRRGCNDIARRLVSRVSSCAAPGAHRRYFPGSACQGHARSVHIGVLGGCACEPTQADLIPGGKFEGSSAAPPTARSRRCYRLIALTSALAETGLAARAYAGSGSALPARPGASRRAVRPRADVAGTAGYVERDQQAHGCSPRRQHSVPRAEIAQIQRRTGSDADRHRGVKRTLRQD